jgi:hypothetical protein
MPGCKSGRCNHKTGCWRGTKELRCKCNGGSWSPATSGGEGNEDLSVAGWYRQVLAMGSKRPPMFKFFTF